MKNHAGIKIGLALLLVVNVAFIYALKSIAVGTAVQEVRFDGAARIFREGAKLADNEDYAEMKKRYERVKGSISDPQARMYLDAFFGR